MMNAILVKTCNYDGFSFISSNLIEAVGFN